MSIDILLNTTEKRSLPLRMNINTRHIVSFLYILHPLLNNKLILLMSQLNDLQLLLVISSHYFLQIFLLFLQRQLQKLLLSIVVLLKIVDVLTTLTPKININMLVKFRLTHLIQHILQVAHRFLPIYILQCLCLMLCLNLYLLKPLLIIQLWQGLHLHKDPTTIISNYIDNSNLTSHEQSISHQPFRQWFPQITRR